MTQIADEREVHQSNFSLLREQQQDGDSAMPDWLDELRERLAGWIGALFPPPAPDMLPVPVPARRSR